MKNTDILLREQKTELKKALFEETWFYSIGIGLVGGEPGLIISVHKKDEQLALNALAKFNPIVPACIRTVENIQILRTDENEQIRIYSEK